MAARIELDLRIGAAFTRLQTLQLQAVVAVLKEKVISYGMIPQVMLCDQKSDFVQGHASFRHWGSLSIGILGYKTSSQRPFGV